MTQNTVENQQKSKHGYMTQAMLENELHSYKDSGFISDIVKEFRIGDPKVTNSKQFYAPFMLQFEDRVRWIIYSTTSMRTDRIKGQQWDAFNLKRLDPSIEKAYITYPDNVSNKEKSEFERQDEKYTTGNEFSSIDRILSHSDLAALVLRESDIKFKEEVCPDDSFLDQAEVNAYNGNDPLKQGQAWDFEGRKFESDLAEILSSKEFFSALKNGNDDRLKQNKCFSIYKEICRCLKIDIANTKEITATSDKREIGLLPTGGSPKTDILVYVVSEDNSQTTHTISCKRSKANNVSVHQYTADAFADVLDEHNDELRTLLNLFQQFGSKKEFSAYEQQLTDELKPYLRKLGLWVLGGVGGIGDQEKHWARFIVTYSTKTHKFSIKTINDYYDALVNTGKSSFFGTPFQWTFASGQRQKSIQLKCPVLC